MLWLGIAMASRASSDHVYHTDQFTKAGFEIIKIEPMRFRLTNHAMIMRCIDLTMLKPLVTFYTPPREIAVLICHNGENYIYEWH